MIRSDDNLRLSGGASQPVTKINNVVKNGVMYSNPGTAVPYGFPPNMPAQTPDGLPLFVDATTNTFELAQEQPTSKNFLMTKEGKPNWLLIGALVVGVYLLYKNI